MFSSLRAARQAAARTGRACVRVGIIQGETLTSTSGVGPTAQGFAAMGASSSAAGRMSRGFAAEAKKRSVSATGPVSYLSLVLTMATGGAMLWYYKYLKTEKMKEVMKANDTSVGKATIGGPFTLKDQDGKNFSDTALHGEFSLLYFGFTHCPDICPDELEKMAASVDMIEKDTGVKVQPVFISVDPERDTVKLVKEYVKEFHPRLIGLTGPPKDIKPLCKSYRVYYLKTNEEGNDYLVDHSIIMYLLDPEGNFVTFYGKNFTAEQMADSIAGHIVKWKDAHPSYHAA